MTNKESILYLIDNYIQGKYNCNNFTSLYIEYRKKMKENDENFSEESELFLRELEDMAYRFSSNIEELAIPNMYYSEDDIKKYLAKAIIDKII